MSETISPVPREARPFQGETAGLVTRVIANVMDALGVGAGLVIGYVGFNGLRFLVRPRDFDFTRASVFPSLAVAAIVTVVYLTVAWSTTGRTYGDHVMGLRVIGPHGRRVGIPRAFVRAMLYVVFPIGLLWCAFSASRRSVQDAVLHTLVIYDWTPRPGSADSLGQHLP